MNSDETLKKIIVAAKKLFLVNGNLYSTMQDIADEAQLSRSLINYYFRSGSKLTKLVFDEVLDSFFLRIKEAYESKDFFFDRISLLTDLFFADAQNYPFQYLFFLAQINTGNNFYLDRSLDENIFFAVFCSDVKAAIKKKQIRSCNHYEFIISMLSDINKSILIYQYYEHIQDRKKWIENQKNTFLNTIFIN